MNDPDRLRKLYIDMPAWDESIKVDDFLVTIGKKQSNSVYHVAEIRYKTKQKDKRRKRFYMMVYKSDLITALRRDKEQNLITMQWYSRDKKKK